MSNVILFPVVSRRVPNTAQHKVYRMEKLQKRIDLVQSELLGILRIGMPDLVDRETIDRKFEELDRLYSWKEQVNEMYSDDPSPTSCA